jgi:hypothetical protein
VMFYGLAMFFSAYLFMFSYHDAIYYKNLYGGKKRFFFALLANLFGAAMFMVVFTKLLSIA